MANRFPLVVSSGTIQELLSDDNLDLTSSGISNATSIGSTTATISGSQSGTGSAPLRVTNGGAYFQGPVGIGTELVGKVISNIDVSVGGTTSAVVFETKGGILVRDKSAVGLGSTLCFLFGDAGTPRIEFYSDGKYGATVAYRGPNSPNIDAGGNNQLEIRNVGVNSSPINITNGEFPRIRIESDGRIAMGSSLGIATNFTALRAAGYGTTAFSSSSGVLQIFSKPDGSGDTDNNSVVLPDGSAWIFPTLGISSVPWYGSNIYSWVFSNKIGPFAFGRALHGSIYNTAAVGSAGGPGFGAGFELGSNSQNDRGAWLSLGGSGRGDGQQNVIAFANGPAGSFAERFRISSAGNIGIATSTPGNVFHLNGGFTFTNRGTPSTQTALHINTTTGAVVETASSRRFKRDIEDYDKGLETLMQLRPVSFKFLEEERVNAGLIAEEVADLGLEEFVIREEDGTPRSIPYENLTALLVKAIQDLKAEVDALKEAQ